MPTYPNTKNDRVNPYLSQPNSTTNNLKKKKEFLLSTPQSNIALENSITPPPSQSHFSLLDP